MLEGEKVCLRVYSLKNEESMGSKEYRGGNQI